MITVHIKPNEKAKQIMHRFFKKKEFSFVMAKSAAITVSKLMIEESEFTDNPKGTEYWKEVKKEAKEL